MSLENIRPLNRTHATSSREPVQWWHSELLEHTHDAVIVWEIGGEGIIYWNRSAEVLYGWRREDARGRITHELLQTELRTGNTDDLENAILRSGTWVGELQHTTRTGSRIRVETRIVLLPRVDDRWLVAEFNREVTDGSKSSSVVAASPHRPE
jgi:two-component system CheB/CheR fusion protein